MSGFRGFKNEHGGSFPFGHRVQIPFGEGSPTDTPSHHLPLSAAYFQPAVKTGKGFWQQLMCQNPLFSVVFPIFCSFPLYQISGLHFPISRKFILIIWYSAPNRIELFLSHRVSGNFPAAQNSPGNIITCMTYFIAKS